MTKIAVFASGSGSNFQAMIDAVEAGNLTAEIALLVCDKPGAYAEKRAEEAAIPIFSFSPKTYSGKAAFEQAILTELQRHGVEWVVLAGYMRLIGPTLLKAYEGRIMNIHPSLLPAFPGLDAIGQAFDARVKVSGVTIHFVDEGMDTGPIIAQEPVRIEENDTREDVQHNIQAVEHRLYPQTIQQVINNGGGA
ncbi:phosphoribosylglycinamide formyltransferase [Salipaludibacillus agaradhaerens]|uniref:Phosphoribosylglycinamide formyltransferase n=1 Tax=Salipaludibacillus agaradhaerens TaxID=76935 RepID=A0A9Q4B3R5_SALAG|nr:phosphoribosylglycinamide formyltransferase [Salipaludibacillus agaradhaerens]MCR6097595.1 phosphoribosylglycinamide formyltransferase [Salipaludibacillus agaradhaerens]MCR6112921.1 phosphoribosylglycinamide formyltransferase [Salipaludibacillus agaradhaerens]